jgi:colanic acid/amylovoran biosynthesis protein
MPNMHIAPDYSVNVEPKFDNSVALPSPFVCLVPNFRVLRHGEPIEQKAYCAFFAAVARDCHRRGYAPVTLLHAPVQDASVADMIDELSGAPLQRIVHADPRVLKGILKTSALVVGSRFHALVSALSQGVPCVGVGWAPKYPALFSQYHCSHCLVSAAATLDSVKDLLDQVFNEPSRSSLVAAVTEAARMHYLQTAEMWREVALVMGSRAAR